MQLLTTLKQCTAALAIIWAFGACKKNKSETDPNEQVNKPSVWARDEMFSNINYTKVVAQNGNIKLLTATGGVAICTWDTVAANQTQAFAARKIDNIALPAGWQIAANNTIQPMSRRFLVFRESGFNQTSLKIRALDNGTHNTFLEIPGSSIDPAFLKFEQTSFTVSATFKIIGDYILVPYSKSIPNAPAVLSFAIVKLKARAANLASAAKDDLAVEKITLINDVNPGAYFGGAVFDATTAGNKFVVSNYGTNTPQTCTISLDGKIENPYAISVYSFIPQTGNMVLGVKNPNDGYGEGLYRSTDGGITWESHLVELPLIFRSMKYGTLNNTLMGLYNADIFAYNITGTTASINIKGTHYTNEGLPADVIINDVFMYGPEKVALATSKGVYTKLFKDFSIEK